MCVSTIGSYSTLGKIVKKYGKTQVNYVVFFVFSHFRLLGLFEEFIEDNISPLGWGTMFQVLKVLEGTGRPAWMVEDYAKSCKKTAHKYAKSYMTLY